MVHRYAAGRIPRTGRKPLPVHTQRVDPRVMQIALRLARGQPCLIRIISSRKVAVLTYATPAPPR